MSLNFEILDIIEVFFVLGVSSRIFWVVKNIA